MSQRNCQSFEIAQILIGAEDDSTNKAFERHVESCTDCQQHLAELAGGEFWWTKTAAHLSTLDQLKDPADVQLRLAESRSFILPTLVTDPVHPDPLSHHPLDWRSILDPPTHPEMLGKIDQFEIHGRIGQGGMGMVLKGVDRELDRAVAIKILSPHLANNGTSRQRFAREAQAAAAVVHPNVVPIYAVNSCPQRPYIVMQLVSGHSLQSLVQERGPLATRELVRVMIQVADGLAAAHQQGLIHRDIKPGNILIEKDVSRVMITDFGLARAADDAGLTQTGWIAGTPHYMSPEQARGDSLDSRSDLFSLGALMYFIATGREPFRAEKPFAVLQKIISVSPTPPQELNPELPSIVADLITKLLEKNPQERYQSASEVRDRLERYLAHLQQPWRVPQPKRELTRRQRRNRWIAGLSLIGITLLGFLGWVGDEPIFIPSKKAPETIAPTSPDLDSETANSPNVANAPEIRLPSPGVGTGGFEEFFSADSSFSSELLELQAQIDSLDRSLRQTNPLQASLPASNLKPLIWQIDQARSQATNLQAREREYRRSLENLLRQPRQKIDIHDRPDVKPSEKQ
jgi:serine/threonine protein kinase